MTDKHVLISGAGGGVGRALCAMLPAHGFTPVAAYHANAPAGALTLDLGSKASIAQAAATLAAMPEPLAGAVLLASPPPEILPFGKLAPADLMRQFQVNVVGPQQLLAELVKSHFRKAKSGFVVGVLSDAMGSDTAPAASSMGAYITAKYGLKGMLKVLESEYPWLKVRTVAPGFIDTPMLGVFDARYLEMARAKKPFLTPDQVAQSIIECITGA